jgi:excinuclease UvrABC helicase subunit UvrB
LALFDFVHKYGKRETDRQHLEQWRPYLLRMHAVARGMVEWEGGHHAEALRIVRDTIARIEALADLETETFTTERERSLEALRDLAGQIEQTQPLSEVERLERELSKAVAAEKFEQAASLRDRIRALRTRVA